MSKLLDCLSKLQEINDNSQYSIALAQDIEGAKDELEIVIEMAMAWTDENSVIPKELRLVYDIAAELGDR